MKMLLGVVGLLVMGCTTPNPKSCLGGKACTDPRYPFCDENGVVAENPETCIAVDCTPGEILECRADTAVMCNGTGTDYDLVQCSLGCDLAGCRMCASSADCTDPTKAICEEGTSTCRGCTADSDCESQVCNGDGSCEPAANLVFASSDGADNGTCGLGSPCSLNRAYVVASGATNTKTVRMLPGRYTTSISLVQTNATPVRIIGRDVTIEPASTIEVANGANVTLEAVAILTSFAFNTPSFRCGYTNLSGPQTTLTLRGVAITDMGFATPIDVRRCALNLTETSLTGGSSYIATIQSSLVVIDRSRLSSRTTGDRSNLHVSGSANSLRVINSVLDRVAVSENVSDTVSPGSLFYLAFNTFNLPSSPSVVVGFSCSASSAQWLMRIENNIFYVPGTTYPLFGNGSCQYNRNIIFPISSASGSNLAVDPKLVDPANGDFRLMPGSPAIDAALPAADLTTAYDFTGAPRPAGAAMDIGAYELQ